MILHKNEPMVMLAEAYVLMGQMQINLCIDGAELSSDTEESVARNTAWLRMYEDNFDTIQIAVPKLPAREP